MTEPVTREAFVPAIRGLPELRITEVVLQTTRWQEMKNPRGIAIDPDQFLAKLRSGVPQAELIRITGAATGAVVAPASGGHR
jgi:hypothetical protein